MSASDFAARGQGPSTLAIGVVPGKIITERVPVDAALRRRPAQRSTSRRISRKSRSSRGTAINDNIGVAFVRGFGMKRGAIACSVGHDSHNITVVGADEADMAVAVNRLIEIEGGFAVADGGEMLGRAVRCPWRG